MDEPGKTTIQPGGVTADLWHVVSQFRWRIGAALLFLVTAKVATVGVPLVLKRIIDAFSQAGHLARLPAYLLAGYALLRFLSTLFNELRDLLFARVTVQRHDRLQHRLRPPRQRAGRDRGGRPRRPRA